MNDVRIGSVALTSENTNIIYAKIDIPPSSLRPGNNNLDIVLNLIPKDDCSSLSLSGVWATIFSDSLLHMPLTLADDTSFALQDLRAYPYPFSNDPSLATTTIVLSQQDISSWHDAGRIAYDLGARILGSIIGFTVMYDGQIKDEYLNNHLIMIGQPKNLTLLSGIKDTMPAYFEDGSNIAVLDTQQVVYRIPDGKDLGYLELFVSPWTQSKAVLGIFGTSSTGLSYAVNGLLNPNIRDQLNGDFATLDGDSVIIVDTRTGMGLGRVDANPNIEVEVVETTTPPPSTTNIEADTATTRQYIIFAVAAIIAIMVVVLIVALILRKRNL
jgi:hypothetical protein